MCASAFIASSEITFVEFILLKTSSTKLFYRKIRMVISHHLALAADEVFESSVELDESYFDGRSKGRRGRGAGRKSGCLRHSET